MNLRATALAAIVLAGVLVACQDAKPQAQAKSEKRHADLKAEMARPAIVRKHAIGNNELVVIDFPVAMGRNYVDRQRCYVWRDLEFKMSNMTCDNAAEPTNEPVLPDAE